MRTLASKFKDGMLLLGSASNNIIRGGLTAVKKQVACGFFNNHHITENSFMTSKGFKDLIFVLIYFPPTKLLRL